MAIQFDTYSYTNADAASSTWSHTCTGTNPLLIVGIELQGTRTVTSITYNGVAMVLINSQNASGTTFGNTYLYRNDTSQTIVSGTAYDIVVTISSSGFLYAGAMSYTGVDQTTPINTNITRLVTSTSVTTTVTTNMNNCWLVAFQGNPTTASLTSASTNTIKRFAEPNNWFALFDSNGARTTGSNTLVMTCASSIKFAVNLAALNPQLPTYQIWDNLTHYWKLDETSGTSMSDAVNGGTALTAGGTINQTGKNNKGVYINQIDGTNIYTNTEINNFEKNEAFSYSLWIKRVDAGSILRGLISRVSRASGLLGYNIAINTNNSIYIELFGGSTSNWIQKSSSANAVPTDTTTFHHLVFTYDGSMNANGVKFYIDGNLISLPTTGGNTLATATTMKVTATYRIGDYEGGSPAKSIIDEVASWNRDLSAANVTELYNSGTGLFYTAPSTVNTGFFMFFN